MVALTISLENFWRDKGRPTVADKLGKISHNLFYILDLKSWLLSIHEDILTHASITGGCQMMFPYLLDILPLLFSKAEERRPKLTICYIKYII